MHYCFLFQGKIKTHTYPAYKTIYVRLRYLFICLRVGYK